MISWKIFSVVLILFTGVEAFSKTLNVVIQGVPANRVEYYRSKVQPLLKVKADLENIQEAMEALYQTNTLSNIEVFMDDISDEKSELIFRLILRQTLKSILVHGNSHLSKSDILNEMGLTDGETYSEDRIKMGIDNVKKLYNLSGYLVAQIGAHFEQTEGSGLNLIVDVEEGSPCLIDNIYFLSANVRLNKDLQQYLHRKMHEPFSQININEIQSSIIDFLTKKKYFSSTLTALEPKLNDGKSRVTLSFVITDPYSYGLVFDGNAQFTDFQILTELKLDENNRLSSSPVDDLKERILRFYKSRGYANITVKHRESVYDDDFVRRINFTINEGARVKIKEIVFYGSYSRLNAYYGNFIFDHSSDLIGKKYYNSDDIDTGVKNLTTELQNQGFIGAQVTSTRADYDKERANVSIKITLIEGPQTFISQIIFKGAKKISATTLEEIIGLQSGGSLQLSALGDAAAKINEYYRNLGYLEVRISDQTKNLIAYSDENRKAILTFEISEGPMISVDTIVIEGNTFTKDYIISRELQFKKGDILTPEKINYSEIKLQRLGLFGSIEIRTLTDDPQEGRRTVLVIVTERNPGVFKSGFGADNELTLTLKGYTGAAYRNLFGTGRTVNARVEVDDKINNNFNFWEKEATLGYTEPFVLGTSNSLKLTGIYSSKLYSINTDNQVPKGELVYALNTLQANVVLERDLNRFTKLIYEIYGFEQTNTYEIFGQAPAMPLDIRSTGPTVIYDRRDNIFNPRRGFLTSANVEFASPSLGSSKSVNYTKTVGSLSMYFPLGKLVFAQQMESGYIWNLSQDAIIPQVKSFILGGRSTIRGFDVTETVPKLTDIANGIQSSYELFYLSKSELRFPIAGNLGGAAFYDGGHLQFNNFTQNFFWRDAVGLGLRYNTPVGPVSIEYGLKLNRDQTRGESPGAFYFSIGVF